MTSRLLILTVAALGLLMVSAASNPADARRGHGSHIGTRSGSHGHHHHRHHHHRHHHNRGILLGAPYYGDYYYSGDACYWLRRRALQTGSRYWWSRYHSCVGY